MKEDIEKVKQEYNAKKLAWSNIKSGKVKATLIIVCIGLIALKIFTTVLTFDWLADVFSSM